MNTTPKNKIIHLGRKTSNIHSNLFRSPKAKKRSMVERYIEIIDGKEELKTLSLEYYDFFSKNDVFRTCKQAVDIEQYLALCSIYISSSEMEMNGNTSMIRLFFLHDETRIVLTDFFQLLNMCYSYLPEREDEDMDDHLNPSPKTFSYELVYWKILFEIFKKSLNHKFTPKDWYFFLTYSSSKMKCRTENQNLVSKPHSSSLTDTTSSKRKKKSPSNTSQTNNLKRRFKIDSKCTFIIYNDLLRKYLSELPRIRNSQEFINFPSDGTQFFRSDLEYMKSIFVDVHLRNFVGNLSSLTTVKWIMIHSKELSEINSRGTYSDVCYFEYVIERFRSRLSQRRHPEDPFIKRMIGRFEFLIPEEKLIIENLYYESLKRIIETETKRLQNLNRNVDLSRLQSQETFKKSLLFVCIVVVLFSTGGFGKLKMKHIMKNVLNLDFRDGIKCFEFFVREVIDCCSGDRYDLFEGREDVKLSIKKFLVYLEEKFYNYFLFLEKDKQQQQQLQKKGLFNKMMFKKYYFLCNRKVEKIFRSLGIENQSDDINRICECVKYVLQNSNVIRIYHLDHALLCSCYIILNKYRGINVKFKDVILHYAFVQEKSNSKTPIELNKILFRIPGYDNVIRLYNEYFIRHIKGFLETSNVLKEGFSIEDEEGTKTVSSEIPAPPARPPSSSVPQQLNKKQIKLDDEDEDENEEEDSKRGGKGRIAFAPKKRPITSNQGKKSGMKQIYQFGRFMMKKMIPSEPTSRSKQQRNEENKVQKEESQKDDKDVFIEKHEDQKLVGKKRKREEYQSQRSLEGGDEENEQLLIGESENMVDSRKKKKRKIM